MKMRKTLSAKIVLLALAVSVIGRLVVSYPLNNDLLQGTDSIAYMHRIWLAGAGNIYWDNFWYEGYPSLDYYAPLNYLFGSFFALFSNSVIAYKIVINFFFALTPIAFYLFVREFGWSGRQKALSVLLFSFFPINIYYFWNGSYVTIINIFFSLLVWRHFRRYAENGGKKDMLFAALFLGISVLVHQLTALLSLLLVFFWALARYGKILIKPAALGLLVSGFWLFPFLLKFTGENFLKPFPAISDFLANAVFHLGFARFGIILLLFSALLIAALKFRGKEALPFMLTLLMIGSVVFFSTYNRVLIFLSLPVAVIFADMACRKKALFALALAAAIIFAAVFFSFQPLFFLDTHAAWDVPQAEGRVMYYPPAYALCLPGGCGSSIMEFTLVAPMQGQEIASGWFPQSQLAAGLKDTKYPYLERISNPLNETPEGIYDLFNSGFVRTAVVNKYYPEYLNYFNSSGRFRKINETDRFAVFSVVPEPSYVEINGSGVNYSLSRTDNRIEIRFACSPGTLSIKESYDSDWNAEIGGKPLILRPDKNGFIEADANETGACDTKLSFMPKKENAAFYVVSFAALAAMMLYFFKRENISEASAAHRSCQPQ